MTHDSEGRYSPHTLFTPLALAAGLAFVLAAATPRPALAQTSASASASIDIPEVLYIEVTNTNVTFPQPTAADFNTGHVSADVTSDLTYRGNVAHDVTVTAGDQYFSGGSGTKPASDLQWSTDGSTWEGLTTSGTNVVTNASRGQHDSGQTVNYRMLLDYSTDSPATYTLNVTYSVVAN